MGFRLPDRVILLGDKVQVYLDEREAVFPFAAKQDLFEHSCYSGILPQGIIYAEKRGNRTCIVHEAAPRIVSTKFSHAFFTKEESQGRKFLPAKHSSSLESIHTYCDVKISIPYFVTIASIFDDGSLNQCCVYFRNSPLRSMSDLLTIAPLPNLVEGPKYGERNCCLGYQIEQAMYNKKPFDAFSVLVNSYWQTHFNYELSQYYEKMSGQLLALRIANWEKQTSNEPEFITTFNWERFAQTRLEHVLYNFTGYNNNPKISRDLMIRKAFGQ